MKNTKFCFFCGKHSLIFSPDIPIAMNKSKSHVIDKIFSTFSMKLNIFIFLASCILDNGKFELS